MNGVRTALVAFVMLVAFAGIAPGGAAFAQCPAPGDCRTARPTPGCEMPECCAAVCKIDFLCCEIAWSESCVELALEACEDIHCPSEGACDESRATPGCADFECCDLVSAIDGWCEFAAWDVPCASEGGAFCGVARCPLGIPGDAIDEDEPCYARLNDGCAVATEGPRMPLACGVARHGRIVGGAPRDLDWFGLDGSDRRRLRLTISAEFPLELQHVLGDCDGPSATRWILGIPPCAGPTSLVFLVDPGASSLVVGGGSAHRSIRTGLDCPEFDPKFPPDPDDPPPVARFGLRWLATIDCLAIGDVDGDGEVDALDLAQLLGAWGPVDPSVPVDPRQPDADLDGDGEVGALDLAALLAGW